MLNRHLRLRDLMRTIAALVLLLGAVGCAQKEEMVTAEQEAASRAGMIPYTTVSEAARLLCEEGEYLADVGRNVKAREKFIAAVAEDPTFVRAHFDQSNVAISYKEFQDCLDKAEVNIDSVSDGERLLVEINRTFLTNDTERGVQLAIELVHTYPDSARAAMMLGNMQSITGDSEAARESYARALEIEPDSPGALMGAAISYLYRKPKDFTMAEECAQKMTAAYPNEAKGYELVGDIKRAQNDFDGALEAYDLATETDPGLAQAQFKKGHVICFLGNYGDALSTFDDAIAAADPETKAAYATYRAFTYLHAGDIDTALDLLESVADEVETMGTPADQVKGQQVFALTSEATAALHAGRYDRAASVIGRRNQLQMEIAEEVGTDDAHRLQKADCRLWDGLLAAYTGDLDAAVEHAERIAVLVENDSNPRKLEPYHFVMGMAYLKLGDYPKAALHLRQADFENDMFIRYHLALAEEGAGKADQAATLFADVAGYNFNSVGFALLREEAKERSEG
jgi:tetratricopeptide (TPR) repeat protein